MKGNNKNKVIKRRATPTVSKIRKCDHDRVLFPQQLQCRLNRLTIIRQVKVIRHNIE